MPARAVMLLLLVTLIWAANIVVSKLAVDTYAAPPLAYAFARSVIVAAALAPYLRRLPVQPLRTLAVGLAISGGSFGLLFVGLTTASPSAAGVVQLAGAPLTVLFAILLLGERVRWRRALGIALAFTGVAIAVVSPSGWESGPGLGFVFAATLVGALGSVFVKRLKIGSLELQAWAAVASIAVLGPATLLLESGRVAALVAHPWELAACLFFAAIVTSVAAHAIYFGLLQRHDANAVVPFTLLTPLLTIALGAWLTGDAVGWPLIAGAAVALGGVAIIVLRPAQEMEKPLLVRPRL